MRSSRISAEGLVPAPPDEVFAFLARLENHWQLADRWIHVAWLDSADSESGAAPDGGAVRIRGPLGLSRTAHTRVLAADPPRRIDGSAELGRSTLAHVSWSLNGADGATRVTLAAEVERLGVLDRLAWELGGRRWMERRFAAVLRGLARRLSPSP